MVLVVTCIEIALNKILRKVWNLPYNSHTAIIVHCVAHASTVSNLVYKRFSSLLCRGPSFSPLVHNVFLQSLQCASSLCGYNNLYGHYHMRIFSEDACTCCGSTCTFPVNLRIVYERSGYVLGQFSSHFQNVPECIFFYTQQRLNIRGTDH